jgi:predicted DNA-binding WGR domain protein
MEAVTLKVLRERVRPRLASAARRLLDSVCAQEDDHALGVLVDEWPVVVPDDARIAVVVFLGAVATDGPIVTRSKDLLGVALRRNVMTFVFLGPVTCSDFITVPDTITILAKGLTVARVAVFDGGDAHCAIAERLRAPYVVAASSGVAHLAPGAKVTMRAYMGLLRGLPPNTRAKKVHSLGELFPKLADDAEDFDAWELLEARVRSRKPFCEIAISPSRRAPRPRVKLVTMPAKGAPPAPKLSAARRKLLFVTRSFKNPAKNELCAVLVGTNLLCVSRGRLDTRSGKVKNKAFKTQEAAFEAAEKLIAELLRDGFVRGG